MKILHIFNDGPDDDATLIVENHKKENEVEIVDLTQKTMSYDDLIDKIEQCDKVISW
jgi:hypothetical protein